MPKKLLVIIPCYTNFSPDIIGCLNKQTFKNFEVVFVWDGIEKKDLRDYNPLFIYSHIENFKNIGCYKSINKALATKFKHEYFCIIGSDDLITDNNFEDRVNAITKDKIASICKAKSQKTGVECYISSQLMFTKKAFLKYGYFLPFRFGMDTEYMKRMQKFDKQNIVEINQALYIYRSDLSILTKEHLQGERKLIHEFINFRISNLDKDTCHVPNIVPRLGIATIKGRKQLLINTLNSVKNQINEIHVFQNDYSEQIQGFENINFHGNINGVDESKFLAQSTDNYYFTIDDDLIYPPDYILRLLHFSLIHNGKAIITAHGRNLENYPVKSYYRDKCTLFPCLGTVNETIQVQFGGSGVMLIPAMLIKVDMNRVIPYMADISISKQVHEQGIPIVCISHNAGWIKQQMKPVSAIFDSQHLNDNKQTKEANSFNFLQLPEIQVKQSKIPTQVEIAVKRVKKFQEVNGLDEILYFYWKKTGQLGRAKKRAILSLIRRKEVIEITKEQYENGRN